MKRIYIGFFVLTLILGFARGKIFAGRACCAVGGANKTAVQSSAPISKTSVKKAKKSSVGKSAAQAVPVK